MGVSENGVYPTCQFYWGVPIFKQTISPTTTSTEPNFLARKKCDKGRENHIWRYLLKERNSRKSLQPVIVENSNSAMHCKKRLRPKKWLYSSVCRIRWQWILSAEFMPRPTWLDLILLGTNEASGGEAEATHQFWGSKPWKKGGSANLAGSRECQLASNQIHQYHQYKEIRSNRIHQLSTAIPRFIVAVSKTGGHPPNQPCGVMWLQTSSNTHPSFVFQIPWNPLDLGFWIPQMDRHWPHRGRWEAEINGQSDLVGSAGLARDVCWNMLFH